MPDGYTHVVTAKKAMEKSGFKAASQLAFGAGANGPDPLFFHKVWKKNRSPNLLKLASRMHKEKTGAFLIALVKHADTPVKKSYAAGFLTHYATDKTAHPYVAFLTEGESAPYHMPHGHGFYECTLDSELYQQDYGSRTVRADRATPTPKKAELSEIVLLFRTALLEVYHEDISEKLLLEAFHDILFLRRCFTSRLGLRRWLFGLAERYLFKEEGYILSNLTPGRMPIKLPSGWVDPFSGEEHTGTMQDILIRAVDVGAEFLNQVQSYWNAEIPLEEFAQIIGNKSYETGLSLS